MTFTQKATLIFGKSLGKILKELQPATQDFMRVTAFATNGAI